MSPSSAPGGPPKSPSIEPHYSQYLQTIQRSLVRWLFSADIMMQFHGNGALSVNVFRTAQGAQSSPGELCQNEAQKTNYRALSSQEVKNWGGRQFVGTVFFKCMLLKIDPLFNVSPPPPPPFFLALYWCYSFRCGCSYWVISFKDANL